MRCERNANDVLAIAINYLHLLYKSPKAKNAQLKMTEEVEEIILEQTDSGENEDKKNTRAAAKRAADLVTHFKEEDSDISESEVEIIHINTVVNGDDESDSSPAKRKKGILDDGGNASKKKRYLQKYVKDWEKVPAFKPWLSESLVGATYFYCKFCKSDNKCGKTELEKHMLSRKHIRNSKGATVRVQVKLNHYEVVLFSNSLFCSENLRFVVCYVLFLHHF